MWVTKAPPLAVLQVSSRLFTALLGELPSHFTDGETEAAVAYVHVSLVRHARNNSALSKMPGDPKALGGAALGAWG